MTLTVIVPLSRPERLPYVLGQLGQQVHRDWRGLIVTNGRGIGAAQGITLPSGIEIIESATGLASLPRNAGLSWVRSRGGGFVSFMDDDDYYGPGYLSEAWSAMRRNPDALVGKSLRWVRFEDGLYFCLSDDQVGLTGGACGGHTSQMRDFPLIPLNEDFNWCLEAKARGIELIDLGPRHFIYNRTNGPKGRVLGVTRLQFLYTFGPARFYGDASDEICWAAPDAGAPFVPKPSRDDLVVELQQIGDALEIPDSILQKARQLHAQQEFRS